ncbi:MAG: fatty acid desaturase [Thiolinea sp.]
MNTDQSDNSWYQTPIDRATMKPLMRRTDKHGIIYFTGFLAIVVICGFLAHLSIGSYWSIPAFLLYGGIWVFATSVVHETCHGTPFHTRWLNETVLFISGLMVQQLPTGLRWTHARHHSETAIVSKDVEVVLTNPLSWGAFIFYQLSDAKSIWYYFSRVVMFSFGKLDAEHKATVPKSEAGRVYWEARAFLTVYVSIVLWSVVTASWWPVLIFLFPRIAGAPTHGVMLATQHIGFAQNIRDHRKTTRTMTLNPLLCFIYWNMNYHVEHHMFPRVPFHALPDLHEAIKHDTPPPTKGVFAALGEIYQTINRQKSNPEFSYPVD